MFVLNTHLWQSVIQITFLFLLILLKLVIKCLKIQFIFLSELCTFKSFKPKKATDWSGICLSCTRLVHKLFRWAIVVQSMLIREQSQLIFWLHWQKLKQLLCCPPVIINYYFLLGYFAFFRVFWALVLPWRCSSSNDKNTWLEGEYQPPH